MTARTYTLLGPHRQPYQSATSGALGGYRPGRSASRFRASSVCAAAKSIPIPMHLDCLLRLILLGAGRGAEWRQRDDGARDETSTRYHHASSRAQERVVCRGSLSDSKWSRTHRLRARPGFGHYGGKASGRPERNVAGAAGATGPLKILSAAP